MYWIHSVHSRVSQSNSYTSQMGVRMTSGRNSWFSYVAFVREGEIERVTLDTEIHRLSKAIDANKKEWCQHQFNRQWKCLCSFTWWPHWYWSLALSWYRHWSWDNSHIWRLHHLRGSVDVHSRLVTEKHLNHNLASVCRVDHIFLI